MGLNVGDDIRYRIIPVSADRDAIIVHKEKNTIILSYLDEPACSIVKGQNVMISGLEGNCFTEVLAIDKKTIELKCLWEEKREYFRIDDVMPILISKVGDRDVQKKAGIISGYGQSFYGFDVLDNDSNDSTISPRLWQLLSDIDNKLSLILDRMYLGDEGLLKAEHKRVNLSASGLKTVVNEEFAEKDLAEVKILLPSSPSVGIIVYGRVVRVTRQNDSDYEISIHFSEMGEEVRNEIIQYTLKRQREIIRKEKGYE